MNLKKLFYLGAAILAFAVVFTACSGGDDSGPGKKTIVNVAITPPVKTQYTDEDTALDLTGLEVTVTFSDGSGITFSGSDVTVTGFTPGTEGEQTITVTYNKNGITFEKSFTVNVSAAGAATMLNLTVVLTTGDGKLTLAPQMAEAGYAFYYNKSAAPVPAPAFGTAISTITGAAAYTASTDINGENGTVIYVQVYKVVTTGGLSLVTGFGQNSGTPSENPDTTPPVPGNSGAITTADITQTSLTLSWTKASDDKTPQASLKYYVYQKGSAFTMDGGLPADGTLLNAGGTPDIATYPVSGLSASAAYFFIVVVEDGSNNRAAYTAKSETTAAAPVKTVEVGPQGGPGIKSGVAGGTASFALTTENIAAGSYDVTVEDLPAGVTVQGQVTVDPNGATSPLVLEGDDTTVTGTYEGLILIIDGASSAPFALTIAAAPPVKTVGVGPQGGPGIRSGVAGGTASFALTTQNITSGSHDVTVEDLPAGVTVQGQVTVDPNGATSPLTLEGDETTEAGTYEGLILIIDGASSAPFALTIVSGAKSVSVGTQEGELTEGFSVAGGSDGVIITFPVTTENIIDGSYTATVSSLPTGVTVSGQVAIAGNSGTLTLTGSDATVAGSTATAMLTIDNTQTTVPFTITITAYTGLGSEDDPYLVVGYNQLLKVASETINGGWTRIAHYRQTANITLGSNWTPIGNTNSRFAGVYDGGGYSISGLTISGNYSYAGLFGFIDGGTVRNVALTGVNIEISSPGYRTGGIAGVVNYGLIENCYVAGTKVKGTQNVGGIAGQAGRSTITNCYVTCNIEGNMIIGGVVGTIASAGTIGTNSTISYCYATGMISGETSYVGGIAGDINANTTISNCVALNPAITITGSGNYYGRIAGMGTGTSTVTLENNRARADMAYTGFTPVVTGDYWTDVAAKDGADVARDSTGGDPGEYYFGQYSGDFWGTSLGFPNANWDFNDSAAPYKLPTLKGFNQEQNPAENN